ncbi:hypothetical protein SAMN05216420_1129 [Nitrosospira sp. Nl5]|uniref:TIGR04282 family arsenosugar biosynthesis glycosyltransferase n=1 Tax=Nitrosospira sp. Nl5 TaxID=200120 RepID=UPI000885D66A|nr:DUF2064 domain-containing protein [Nitrosospira sp. Nl5]SCY66170.1 hypothetical protein SAMN05216420_1129 [Nitrosospira sp. Nl5]
MIETALVLVCKRPSSGIGKQRLAATLGPEIATRIAEALLACALEDACEWPGPVVIAPAHPSDCAWAGTLLPQLQPKVRILPQATAGNLGLRLNGLDQALRDAGMKRLVYIGSDAPALAAADYDAVNDALLRHDTVLIPAEDGGVVLMASCRQWPMLGALPWSTARLGAALADCCRAIGQSVAMLTQSFDVDERDDFFRLSAALRADRRPARRALHALACDLVQLRQADHV